MLLISISDHFINSIIYYQIIDIRLNTIPIIINSDIVLLPSPYDSILLAVLTVSPNKQYRGILLPTTPATTGPTKAVEKINKIILLIQRNQ